MKLRFIKNISLLIASLFITHTIVRAQNVQLPGGIWILPAQILSNTALGNARDPQIAVDCNSNVFAVWSQYDSGATGARRIYANRYDVLTGKWQDPSTTTTLSNSFGTLPQIAFDCKGNAFAVFEQNDLILANRYDVLTGWQDPSATTTLSNTALGNARDPQIAVDCNSNAFAVWRQDDSGTQRIYANRYDASTEKWQDPSATTTLSNPALGSAYDPQIAIDCNGNAFAVWRQVDSGTQRIYANRYDVLTGWQDPSATTTLSNPALGSAYDPQIAVDCNSNAFAVWSQYDSGATGARRIHANRYDASTEKWQDPSVTTTLSNTALGNARDPQIAFDCNGNAFTVFVQNSLILANRYDVLTGKWQDPSTTTTLSNFASEISSPQIAFDCKGNAFAVWKEAPDTTYRIYANRYDVSTGKWQDPSVVTELSAYATANDPQIAFDCNGNAFVVFEQNDQIYVAPFATVPIPSNIRVCQELHRFPTQADLINVIRWDQVSYVNQIVKYKIYCVPYSQTEKECCATGCFCYPPLCCCGCGSLCANAELIGEVLGSAPRTFCHHARCPCQRVRYCISAVDTAGNESFIPGTVVS